MVEIYSIVILCSLGCFSSLILVFHCVNSNKDVLGIASFLCLVVFFVSIIILMATSQKCRPTIDTVVLNNQSVRVYGSECRERTGLLKPFGEYVRGNQFTISEK